MSDVNKVETMALAEEVLADLHFAIDKADVPSGFIRTRPLPGAQFFEFWRGDNIGTDNALQANLHSIRRTVELNVTEKDDKVHIDCNVKVQRLSMPEREITSSARAYDMFSRSSPSFQRLTLNPDQERATTWTNLADDTLLASEILKRIEKRIVARTNNKPQPTRDQT